MSITSNEFIWQFTVRNPSLGPLGLRENLIVVTELLNNERNSGGSIGLGHKKVLILMRWL